MVRREVVPPTPEMYFLLVLNSLGILGFPSFSYTVGLSRKSIGDIHCNQFLIGSKFNKTCSNLI